MFRFSISATRAGRCAPICTRRGVRRHLSQNAKTPKQDERPGGSPTPRNTAAPASTDIPELENIIPPQNFARPTLSALDFWFRFAKFSLIGLAIVTGGTIIGFEGAHVWVENVELAPPSDPDGELARWGWLKEAERWTGGGERGGTDPALGYKAAHALRSAWMAQHWGTGAQIISSNAMANAQNSNTAVDARLEYSHDFVTLALALAAQREREGKPIRPETMCELLVRRAATLERIGTKGTLYDARAAYERVWDVQPNLGTETEELARLALKLGDVNARLGDTEEARSWWARSLLLVSSESNSQSASGALNAPDPHFVLPERLPPSPHAQRTLSAVLSSLSASYAQAGLLADAKSVQDAGIALLASYPSNVSNTHTPFSAPSSSSSSEIQNLHISKSNSTISDSTSSSEKKKSAPQALHELYLQHRLSLLALHRAEVTYALRASSAAQTLEELAQAAIEAENVVHALSSSSSASASLGNGAGRGARAAVMSDAFRQTKLDRSFTAERTLSIPADSLLRDARRTAVHSWTLSGILHENAASSSSSSISTSTSSSTSSTPSSGAYSSPTRSLWKKVLSSTVHSTAPDSEGERERGDAERRAALRCYVRALAWAGAPLDGSESGGQGQGQGRGQGREPEPARDMLESEWKALWAGYVRTRDAVFASTVSAGAGRREGEDK